MAVKRTALRSFYDDTTIVSDYKMLIGMGLMAGHDPFRGFGYRSGLSTAVTGDDIWQGAATTQPVPNQTTGEQMVIVSSAAADSSAGANVRKIHIHYLDSGGNEQKEIVTMNGVTPVNTAATNIRFVQHIHTYENGTFGAAAAGNISVYKVGDAATVYAYIKAGENKSLDSSRMVPNGKTFYLSYISVSGASGKPLSIRLRATSEENGTLFPGIFLFNELFSVQDSIGTIMFDIPRKFPSLAIVKGTVFSSQAGGECTINYGGWIE